MPFTLGGTLSAGPRLPVRPEPKGVARLEPAKPPAKRPSAQTIVNAKLGDKAAQFQVDIYAKQQRAKREGTAQAQALSDNALFGGSENVVLRSASRTRLNPIGQATIGVLSPIEAARTAYGAASRGNLLGAGLAAAGIFPFGKPARAAKVVEDIAKAGRAAKTAADLTPEEKVLRSTGSARELRAQQARLYSAERARRAAKVEVAHQIGGQAGYRAALAALKGELPKVRFDQLTSLTDPETDQLFTIVQQHPSLRPFEKVTLQGAILKAREGRVPAPHEIKLIEKAFGPEAAAQARRLTPLQKLGRVAAEIINTPRSVLASFDVSAPFRQGLVAGAAHPQIFARNFGPMFKALISEKKFGAIMQEIANRPSFPNMQEAGLKLTDLGDLSHREEQFMSNLAERIPGIRASARAYTGFLNRTRADVFDHLVSVTREQGIDTPRRRRDIARFANFATGRGELGRLEPAAVILNTGLFSPRLFASRINALNPAFYASLDPFVRRQALGAMLRLVGAGVTVLGLAKLAGVKVNDDPRNADFGKIRLGNTRVDIWGGHQQLVRLFAQLSSGRIVSSTTGQTYRLKGGRSLSRRDIGLRFLEGKLAPVPSLVNDFFKGTDFADKPFSLKRALVQRSIPLMVQDAQDLYNATGSLPKALAGYGVGAFGIGFQTYGPKPSPTLSSKTPNAQPVLGSGGVDSSKVLSPGFGSAPSPGGSSFKLGGTLAR